MRSKYYCDIFEYKCSETTDLLERILGKQFLKEISTVMVAKLDLGEIRDVRSADNFMKKRINERLRANDICMRVV